MKQYNRNKVIVSRSQKAESIYKPHHENNPAMQRKLQKSNYY